MVGELLVNGFYLLGFGRRMGGEWFGIYLRDRNLQL